MTRRHMPEDLNLQHHHCQNIKSPWKPLVPSLRHRRHNPTELSNDSIRYLQTQLSIFCSPNIQTGPWTQSAPWPIGTGGSFPVDTAGRAWS